MLFRSVERNMTTHKLKEAIETLPEPQQRRLLLYYIIGFTYEEIAEIEGCSHPAVIKSVNAAIKKLKKFLEK